MKMEEAYKEVQACLRNNQHNISTDSLQLCLEALRIILEEKHNGLTNYPTWLIASEIDNSNFYEVCYTKTQKMKSAGKNEYEITNELAVIIRDFYERDCTKYRELIENKANKTNKNYGGYLWSSMLNHCNKDLIKYREIAKRFVDDTL